jgi:hypothetical protein
MRNPSILHLLLLSVFLLSATCDARQSRIQQVSNGLGFPRNAALKERKAQDSRWLKKAGTDDTTAAAAAAGGNGRGSGPAPEDDDGSEVITDDAVVNKTSHIPREPEQPSTWPATVLVIFLVLAAGLLGKTAYTNLKKRSQYQNVPATNLTV